MHVKAVLSKGCAVGEERFGSVGGGGQRTHSFYVFLLFFR